MSSQQFAPEFRDEAVRQVLDWRYPVTEVARRIVGSSMKPTLAREIVIDAILMAVCQSKPRGTLIHSDQGSQYGSHDWLRFCREHHLEPSMSRRGNCRDNAVAESFFSSLKKERIKKRIYRTRDLARTGPTSSTTLGSSTIERAGTAASAVLARRPSRVPQNEARNRPR